MKILRSLLRHNLTLGEALTLCFLSAVAVTIGPHVIRAINQGIILSASTWLAIAAALFFLGVLMGIVVALRMSREVARQFERLTVQLLEKVEQKMDGRSRAGAGLHHLAKSTQHLATSARQSEDKKRILLLANGIDWILQKPIAQDVILPGCCAWCQMPSPLYNDERSRLDIEAGIIDPKVYLSEYHTEDCPLPEAYFWSNDLVKQVMAETASA